MLSNVNGPLKCDGPLNCWLIFDAFAHSLRRTQSPAHKNIDANPILDSRFARFIRTNDKFDFLCYSFQLDFWLHHSCVCVCVSMCVQLSFIYHFTRALKFWLFFQKTKSSAFNWDLDIGIRYSFVPRSRILLTYAILRTVYNMYPPNIYIYISRTFPTQHPHVHNYTHNDIYRILCARAYLMILYPSAIMFPFHLLPFAAKWIPTVGCHHFAIGRPTKRDKYSIFILLENSPAAVSHSLVCLLSFISFTRG